jgi:hypothetical protein
LIRKILGDKKKTNLFVVVFGMGILFVFLMKPNATVDATVDATVELVYQNKLSVADSSALDVIGPIYLNAPLSEKIEISKRAKVSEIQLLLATYARLNQGTMTITLNRDGKTLVSKNIDLSTVVDNSYLSWKFKPQEFESGEELEILVMSDAPNSSNGIAVYATKIRSDLTRDANLAGAQIEGSLIMNIIGAP